VGETRHWLSDELSWLYLVKVKDLVSMGTVEHPEMAGAFADFDAGHRDLVSVTKFNFYGNRIVTASSDHRMKVWDLKDNQWQLTDTWRAHDAEIRDVRPEDLPCG